MAESLMTAEEVSEVLQIGLSTVYLLLQRGELASVRIGRCVRIRPPDLDEFIELRARGDRQRQQVKWNLDANLDPSQAL